MKTGIMPDGRELTISQISKETGIPIYIIKNRVIKYGDRGARLVRPPDYTHNGIQVIINGRYFKSVKEACRYFGIPESRSTAISRKIRRGLDPEIAFAWEGVVNES